MSSKIYDFFKVRNGTGLLLLKDSNLCLKKKLLEKEELIYVPPHYQVNLLVSNSSQKKRPIIVENHPNYKNLFGTIERAISTTGLWQSNFTNVKSGSILKSHTFVLFFFKKIY